jgi:hypothetical protein
LGRRWRRHGCIFIHLSIYLSIFCTSRLD